MTLYRRDRDHGRSRGSTPLGTLPLRPLPSGGDRGRCSEIVVLDGELVGPEPPLARPVGARLRGEQVFADELAPTLTVRHVHEREPVVEARRLSSPVFLLLYVLCGLAAVVFVVFALSIAGRLNGTPSPWKQDAVWQAHQHHPRPQR